jgi:general secretion pathway protein G
MSIFGKRHNRMPKRKTGFTLIELLIVVAVVGILSMLIIPNAILAIQKAKQKQTMIDIVQLATAVADYVTDRGEAPDPGNQSGPLQVGGVFVNAIAPVYIKRCPINDQWGNPFRVYTGSAVGTVYNIPADGIGADDFLIVSLGRDKAEGGTVTFTYQSDNLISGIYEIRSIADFKNDLINFDGSWIHAPRIGITSSGS